MLFALLAIVVAAPFERPLFAVPGGFTLTTVEAVVIVAAVAMAIGLGPRRLLLDEPTPLAIAGGLFLVCLAIAALAAPSSQGNALRFTARMTVAAALFVMTLRIVDSRGRARIVAGTMVAVATVVAAIAVLESAQVPAVMGALTLFRPGFHVVAGQLRATSTLFYPTIASMYLEVAFAVGLWLLLDHADSPGAKAPRLKRTSVFVALVCIGAGIAATFTRAGLIAMGVAMLTTAALRLARVPPRQAGLARLTVLAAALVAVVLLSHAPELLATRLTTEGSQAWYGARYEVPAALELTTGRLQRVPVRISNTGRLPWDSTKEPAFAMAYHWLRPSGEVVQFDGARTPFPTVVAPGQTVAFDAEVVAPGQPGDYTLVWDVVHETRAWLSTEGVAPAHTVATVTGAPTTAVAVTMSRLPTASVTPARPALWSAALAMAADHPWLGVGPDNYRHTYGPYLQLREWDHRVHANNMYLEVLAGAGAIGLLAFLALVSAAGVWTWSRVRQARDQTHIATLAALVLWMTIAGHGLVDSFLAFTTTYATFAIAAGVALSPGLIARADVDAHRV